MKQRVPRPGSNAYYIEKILRYEAQHERGEDIKDGYAPIMLELLMQLLISSRIRLRLLCGFLGFTLGLFLAFLLFGL